eukprot:TRINITY_DN2546_c0_g1_i2.p1 TRINITY_DN2546_c0_g1~~TRINITY_DN2546_c0_g1_i2.p1  ORF type:complete len:384 (-),score=83.45 TRINITY_DN2546_c0_g1_i2:161-1312(-)
MSLFGMPFLVVNMGGEMSYILEQRLQAQAISNDKSKKVLSDVLKSMFNTKFIQELFRPQELYSHSSTRGIFDKLAHSSIMRLSESSMDKLYDLMTMGFKYQLVCVTYPQEIMGVTMNHLESMRLMVVDSPEVLAMLDATIDMFKSKYDSFSQAEWNEVRQTLLRFYQDKKVKVSLFLQEKLQTSTGWIVFPPEDLLPPATEVPGKIKYYNEMGVLTRTTNFKYTGTAKTKYVPLPPPRTHLGLNLYAKRVTNAPSSSSSSTATAQAPAAPKPTVTATPSVAPPLSQSQKEEIGTGAQELNLLAYLITPNSANEKESLKVDLFRADVSGADTSGFYEAVPVVETITLDVEHQTNPLLESLAKNFNISSSSQESDLLDLLDSTSK